MFNEDTFFQDPYGCIGSLYPNAYVAGWNAAEKWDLLDESTRDITLFSPKKILKKSIYGVKLHTQILPPEHFFGLTEITTPFGKYLCSDLEKTVVDAMLYPDMFGGERNHKDIIENYMQRDDKDLTKLRIYFRKVGHPGLMIRMTLETT